MRYPVEIKWKSSERVRPGPAGSVFKQKGAFNGQLNRFQSELSIQANWAEFVCVSVWVGLRLPGVSSNGDDVESALESFNFQILGSGLSNAYRQSG